MTFMQALRGVIQASNTVVARPSEDAYDSLESAIEVLVNTSDKSLIRRHFGRPDMSGAECLGCLVQLLADPNIPNSLLNKICKFFLRLVRYHDVLHALRSSYGVVQPLAAVIGRSTVVEPQLIMVLTLLQALTFDFSRASDNSALQPHTLHELLKQLMKIILNAGTSPELLSVCLGVLANLCRESFSAQSQIKTRPDVRELYKLLFANLQERSKTVMIYSLSVFASLCLHEEIGNKFFSASLLPTTFALLFDVLTKYSGSALRCAVLLLADLLKNQRILQPLQQYSKLGDYVSKISRRLMDGGDDLHLVVQALLTLCSADVAVVSSRLCDGGVLNDAPLSRVLSWSVLPAGEYISEVSIRLLTECLQSLLRDERLATDHSLSAELIRVVSSLLQSVCPTANVTNHAEQSRGVAALQLIQVLSTCPTLQEALAVQFTDDVVRSVVEWHIHNNPLAATRKKLLATQHNDECCSLGCETVLRLVHVLHCLGSAGCQSAQNLFVQLTHEGAYSGALAGCLCSARRERVSLAVESLTAAAQLQEFPGICLVDSVAAINSVRLEASTSTPHSASPLANKENTQPAAVKREMEEIKPVVSQFSGLEVSGGTNVISIYEQKLKSLELREGHLQDLLEAKALAVQQADRLLAQYRAQKTDAEAEGHQLRGILLEAERLLEEERGKVTQMTGNNQKLQQNIQELVAQNTRLDDIGKEHQQLLKTLSGKNEQLQRTLNCLNTEQENLKGINQMLVKHNETLKQQLTEAEQEVTSLNKVIAEKDGRIGELLSGLSRSEEDCRTLKRERDEVEEGVDKLRAVITKQELDAKEVQSKVTSLELTIKKQKQTIAANDRELEKLRKIAELLRA